MENFPEEILTEIVKYSNLKSKLNLMSTSKQFNCLINQDSNLHKDFHLQICNYTNEETIRNCSRNFNSITLMRYTMEKHDPQTISDFFERIGKKVKKLEIYGGNLKLPIFFHILDCMPDLEEVSIIWMGLPFNYHRDFSISNQFQKLKVLNVKNFSAEYEYIFRKLFENATKIHKMDLYKGLGTLHNKTNLKELFLRGNASIPLEDMCFQLKELQLKGLSSAEGITQLNEFVKTQTQIEKFRFFEPANFAFNNVRIAFEYLMDLKSLKVFETDNYDVLGWLNGSGSTLKSYSVEELIINHKFCDENSLFEFIRVFPCLKRVKIHSDSLEGTSICLINKLDHLEELIITGKNALFYKPKYLQLFNIPNLKKFHCRIDLEMGMPEIYEDFMSRHKKITDLYLQLYFDKGITAIEIFTKYLENLERLAINGVDPDISLWDLFQLIGRKCKKLKYFFLKVYEPQDFGDDLVSGKDYLKETIPGIKCVFRKDETDQS